MTIDKLVEALQSFYKESSSTIGAVTAATKGTFHWLLDSGASFHMTPHEHCISNLENTPTMFFSTADETSLKIKSIGDFESQSSNNRSFKIPNVRCIPKLNLSLIRFPNFRSWL
ncbi:hypothetical protein QML37_30800 [Klebsiella pneumoniae]|uniref:hypothetical protein n=1 Tax=Klebsiella pneumoniae TaxID=573 RepID=UPI003A7FC1FF